MAADANAGPKRGGDRARAALVVGFVLLLLGSLGWKAVTMALPYAGTVVEVRGKGADPGATPFLEIIDDDGRRKRRYCTDYVAAHVAVGDYVVKEAGFMTKPKTVRRLPPAVLEERLRVYERTGAWTRPAEPSAGRGGE
jgi:hypothetical protein